VGPQGFSTTRDLCVCLSGLADSLRAGGAALEAGLLEDLPRRLREILAVEGQLRELAFPADGTSGGGEAGEHAATAPVLTSPALADAMRALEALNHSIGGAINRLLQQQQDWAAVQRQNAREQQLERRVMALMFTDPGKLSAAVEELRGKVQALAAAARGGAGPVEGMRAGSVGGAVHVGG
jgi:hypothetical protein